MSRQHLILTATLGSVLLLGGAFVFQMLGYAPCHLCLLQRWPHAAAIVIGGLALCLPWRVLPVLGAVAAAVTSGLGIYHTGVEQGWWQGPTSCTGDGGLGGMSGSDLLSMDGPSGIVMCDQVAWALAGVSMASWNAIFSALLVCLWLAAARRR